MITEQDLKEAIAECQGQRNPNANTCIKLAAFLTIQRELYGNEEHDVETIQTYSYDSGITYESQSEFSKLIKGKPESDVFMVMDELMDALKVLNPRLYESVLRKLR